MDIKRKQHLLPESYLKRWTDPATTVEGKTPMVWTFSNNAKRKQLKPPASSHFWRDFFYDLISASGERRQNLENLLGRIESNMVRIIDERILHKQPLNQIEAGNCDLFVACMFMRTQRMRESIGAFVSAKARIEKDYARAFDQRIPDTSCMEHNAHAHAICDSILFLSDELARMSHNVFIAPVGKIYLTSDAPCLWQSEAGFPGLANPFLEITLPLTPRHLLHISRTIPSSGYIDALAFMVDLTNWETIRNCQQYFISNSPTLDTSWLETETYWKLKMMEEAAKLGV